jgi:hypothetical protein
MPVRRQDEGDYLRLLDSALRTGTFYYSPTFDITHSMQRIAGQPPARGRLRTAVAGSAPAASARLTRAARVRRDQGEPDAVRPAPVGARG